MVALVPTILAKLNVTDAYTDLRLRLISTLSATGVLDVRATIQVKTAASWITKMIPSLNTFLGANMDIAVAVGTAWAGVDAAAAANSTKVTGGSALTNFSQRDLTLTSTPADLVHAAKDTLLLTCTKAASGANLVALTVRVETTFTA